MDYSSLSNQDLLAIANSDYKNLSNDALMAVAGTKKPAQIPINTNQPEWAQAIERNPIVQGLNSLGTGIGTTLSNSIGGVIDLTGRGIGAISPDTGKAIQDFAAKNRAITEQTNAPYQEQYPITNYIGQGAGYIAPYTAALKGVRAAGSLAKIAPPVTTLGKVGEAALAGGTTGAVTTPGGAEERATQAAIQGAGAGAGELILPWAGGVAKGAWNKARGVEPPIMFNPNKGIPLDYAGPNTPMPPEVQNAFPKSETLPMPGTAGQQTGARLYDYATSLRPYIDVLAGPTASDIAGPLGHMVAEIPGLSKVPGFHSEPLPSIGYNAFKEGLQSNKLQGIMNTPSNGLPGAMTGNVAGPVAPTPPEPPLPPFPPLSPAPPPGGWAGQNINTPAVFRKPTPPANPVQASQQAAASRIQPVAPEQPLPPTQTLSPEQTLRKNDLLEQIRARGNETNEQRWARMSGGGYTPPTQAAGPVAPEGSAPVNSEITMADRLAALKKTLPIEEPVEIPPATKPLTATKESATQIIQNHMNGLYPQFGQGSSIVDSNGIDIGAIKDLNDNVLLGYARALEKAGFDSVPEIPGYTQEQVIRMMYTELTGKKVGRKASTFLIDKTPRGNRSVAEITKELNKTNYESGTLHQQGLEEGIKPDTPAGEAHQEQLGQLNNKANQLQKELDAALKAEKASSKKKGPDNVSQMLTEDTVFDNKADWDKANLFNILRNEKPIGGYREGDAIVRHEFNDYGGVPEDLHKYLPAVSIVKRNSKGRKLE